MAEYESVPQKSRGEESGGIAASDDKVKSKDQNFHTADGKASQHEKVRLLEISQAEVASDQAMPVTDEKAPRQQKCSTCCKFSCVLGNFCVIFGMLSIWRTTGADISTFLPPNPLRLFDFINLDDTLQHTSLTDVITDPPVMFNHFGFVQPPLLMVGVQAYIKLFTQLCLFFGWTLFEGLEEMINLNIAGKLTFSSLSLAFQLVGLATTLHAYTLLIIRSKPWLGWDNLQLLCFLLTTHSATVTNVVGLANNYVIMKHGTIIEDDMIDGPQVARYLVVASGVISLPMWAAILTCMLSWYSIACLTLAALLPFGLIVLSEKCQFPEDSLSGLLERLTTRSLYYGTFWFLFFTITLPPSLAFVWFCQDINGHENRQIFLEACLVLYTPLLLLVLATGRLGFNASDSAYVFFLGTFVASNGIMFTLFLLVPASIIASQPGIDPKKAAGIAFRGRNMSSYMNYAFMSPVNQTLTALAFAANKTAASTDQSLATAANQSAVFVNQSLGVAANETAAAVNESLSAVNGAADEAAAVLYGWWTEVASFVL